jgi:hypothetical protein
MGSWQDYTFYQEVAVKDNVFPTNSEITKFTWDFRGDVSVYDSTHWAQFRASKTPSPIFALIALAASQKIVARDWINWVEWRRQKVAEKQQGGI